MPEVRFGSRTIPFERKRSKSDKYVTIRVSPGKEVTVLAPRDLESQELDTLVARKAPWIVEKFRRIDEAVSPRISRECVSGEGFPYKGRLLRLKVLQAEGDGDEKVGSDTTVLLCELWAIDPRNVKAAVLRWYKGQARSYLTARAQRFSKRLAVEPKAIGIRDQDRRWGSCTKDGQVLFNWRVIMAPPSVIDYVIVHELVHLRRRPHSFEFWDQVKSLVPDYDAKREWLRINGSLLTL